MKVERKSRTSCYGHIQIFKEYLKESNPSLDGEFCLNLEDKI